ncbi:relaxin receptor 2-like [Lytechinus variegatus]|uniref:relaxin receptor 2-like n=1 Tax=Lytechinus variegatus TaxID=7654 RepID=UPI001BB160B5|nr:relaxin receptor 2-like [Lytechinus variegatus]
MMTTPPQVETTLPPGSGSDEDKYVPSLSEWQECCNGSRHDINFNCDIVLTAFSSCNKLLDNLIIEVLVWVVGLSSFVGNTSVLLLRSRTICSKASRISRINAIMILSLASADILNGIYLLIIGAVNAKFGKNYYFFADEWLESPLCQIAGFLATLSGQTSVFMLTVISIERMLAIVFPFRLNLRMGTKVTWAIVLLVWCVSIFICSIPFMFPESFTGFYGNSDVCIGLPVGLYIYAVPGGGEAGEMEIEGSSWYFGIAIYVGINILCLLVILICYVIIFVTVKRSGRNVKNTKNSTQEIQLAGRMSLIVCTDFAAWFPIVTMFILVIARAWDMPATLYAFVVAILLPINSALNPYIYTVTQIISKRRRRPGKTSNGAGSRGISLDKLT